MTGVTASGRLGGLEIRIHTSHAALHAPAAAFLHALAGAAGQAPSEALDLCLDLITAELPPVSPAGTNALIQFAGVSCVQHDSRMSFRTKDGSTMTADIAAGRASGRLTSRILEKRHQFTDLLLAPLMEMLKHRGLFGLHAAGVTRAGRGYLLPGHAGSGKTTTALGLIRGGFQYFADDKILLQEARGEIRALAFTRRFNIDPGVARCYPELALLDAIEPLPLTNKRPFDLSTLYPGAFVSGCRPDFILHLRLAPEATTALVALPRADSFQRLVQQTILSSQRAVAQRQLAVLAALVEQTDSYVLTCGRDSYGSPPRLARLLPA